ncbi:hypothetical protein RKD23_006381 [Streptomyces sp. SAI-170]
MRTPAAPAIGRRRHTRTPAAPGDRRPYDAGPARRRTGPAKTGPGAGAAGQAPRFGMLQSIGV